MLAWNKNDIDDFTNNTKKIKNNESYNNDILQRISKLTLDNSETHFISYYVYELNNLKELKIINGFIDFISPEIIKLNKLEKLIFNRTLINQLPENIETLINLHTIDCSYNCNFTTITPNIKFFS